MSRRNPRRQAGNVRSDRIGSMLREIIADELLRVDDDSVAHVTVTDVDVDNELTRARVYLSTLDLDDEDIELVREHSRRFKQAIARRAKIRRVPELEFVLDPGLVSGTRVDSILRDMAQDRAFATDPEVGQAPAGPSEGEEPGQENG